MFKKTALLQHLQSEAEAAIELAFQNSQHIGLLFSGGKDSTVLASLIEKVAVKLERDYSFVQIDTGFGFPELVEFQSKMVKAYGRPLVNGSVDSSTPADQTNRAQSEVLNKIILEQKFDALFAGARREEGQARQKELFFSKRENGQGWQPNKVQAEFWPYLDLGKKESQHYRVYPLSNWTEMDVWSYIDVYGLEVCPLYFSHQNPDGQWVRYRTLGDQTNSVPVKSRAQTPWQICQENLDSNTHERASRKDDRFSPFSLEIRKKEGYF